MRKLKMILSAMLALFLLVPLSACSSGGDKQGNAEPPKSNETLTGESRILVAYFSWSSSHNTETMAEYVAGATGGELFRLIPETPYTTDYDAVIDQAQKEKNEGARPKLREDLSAEQWENYDVIFIGYPIWWGIAAWPVDTFVKNNDFTGKTVIPFATSSSSGMGQSGSLLADMAGTGEWQEGQRFSSGVSSDDVQSWVNGLGL